MGARELATAKDEEAQRIADIVAAGARADALKIGRLLASRQNSELFGTAEFQVRDAVHWIGTRALETALEEQKKGYCGSSCDCSRCGDDAAFKGYTSKRCCRCWGRSSIREPTNAVPSLVWRSFHKFWA